MPIIANAKKALRQSKTKDARNSLVRASVRAAIKKTTAIADASNLSKMFSAIDKAVKRNIIHKNKAARIKSRVSKKVATTAPVKVAKVSKPKTKAAAKPKKTK